MKKLLATLFISATTLHTAHADVGMWIPTLIGKNISQMQHEGLHLSADDIYSTNHASLKDAVVMFGGGCTGEIVSADGLVLTNHHCGYQYIQQHSSVEHNYLANGFWATDRNEELPCYEYHKLSVQLLNYIEDVTSLVLDNTDTIATDNERKKIIKERCKNIEHEHQDESKFIHAEVESFYGGNQYLLFVYTEYPDVRLVGAPPSEIGKFGGDTDNWVWPRHTGDFSIFRIYADKNNNPAEYSADNVPFHPQKHLKISTKGVAEGDFAMVMGYPGSTDLYATATDIEMTQNIINPKLIELRTAKLNVMNKHQARSEKVDIQYAAKNAQTSNAWKKWKGEVSGLRKTHAVEKKRNFEAELRQRSKQCDTLLSNYETYRSQTDVAQLVVALNYWYEAVSRGGIEALQNAYTYHNIASDDADAKPNISFKDFDFALSEEMAGAVWSIYCKNIPKQYWPKSMQTWKGSPQAFISSLYANSIFASEEKLSKLCNSKHWQKTLNADPAYTLLNEMLTVRDSLLNKRKNISQQPQLTNFSRNYIKAIMQAYPDSIFPPDANFTMRISYGHVAGYDADDAVSYNYFTTLDGIIEKSHTGNPDYSIPQRLADLYAQKAYLPYADPTDGKLHVAFVSTCHTTGGNSGSPVLNANGELIGLNFDRAWNGVMSDMSYDPTICRNITLDIRYLLFIVDKYAGASNLVKELTN